MRVTFQQTQYPVTVWKDRQNLPPLKPSRVYGLDIETTGLNPYEGDIRLVQVFDGETIWVFDASEDVDYQFLRSWLAGKDFVAHNAIFEMSFLWEAGVYEGSIGCSQLLYNLWLHSQESFPKKFRSNLAAACKHVFGIEIAKDMQNSDWSGELSDRQIEYAALDAVATYKLAFELLPRCREAELMGVYNLYKEAQVPITVMQLNGIGVNQEQHNHLCLNWFEAAKKYEKECRKVAPDIGNLNSSKQISEWLVEQGYDKEWPRSPKTGNLQINAQVLPNFLHIPLIQPLMEYKKYQKLLNTYGEKFLEYINPVTNRVHCSFTLGFTETGRLSCRRPNLQNQPRSSGMRSVFVPSEGHTLLVADYSQIELRCAAMLSGDKEMLHAYATGEDLHSKTAAAVTGKAEVTKEDRQLAKAVNFGLLFGAGAKTLQKYAKNSYGVEMSEKQAQKAVDAFRTEYSGYRKWQEAVSHDGSISLESRTPCGKLRCLDKKGCYTRSMNTPVQGGAAEVILLALINVQRDMGHYCQLVNCVHDEIVLEVPEDKKSEAKEQLHRCMEEAMLKVFPGASTLGLVESNFGNNWEEAK